MAVGTIELAQDIDRNSGWVASSFDLVLAVDKLILLNFVSPSISYASQSTWVTKPMIFPKTTEK